jgi:polynucleotide 5'-hydroxyl-kinase GRC3/NOL9
LSPEVTPEDWLRAIEDCTNTPSISLVTVPADSGKSTFCRRLLNRYLTGLGKNVRPVPAVCFLDLDPSKPEFTTSGQISLVVVRDVVIKPSFVHPATVPKGSSAKGNETIRAYPVPTSLLSYAEYYQSCAEELFMTYKNLQSHNKPLPLVITVPGHLHTSRFDILERLLERFKPHNIVYACNPKAIDVDTAAKLHSIQTISSRSRGTVHTITAQAPLSTPIRTDTELQVMQTQSYFHLSWSRNKADGQEAFSWNPDLLSTFVPWEFCYQETDENTQTFVGFALYTEPVEPASLLTALNGSIVQIVESTSSVIPSPYTGLPRTNKYGIPYFPKSARTAMVEPLDPRTSKLICSAMLRGFDLDRRVVQVLVPKIYEEFLHTLSPEKTVFVYGCCDSSEWVYLEDAYAKGKKFAHGEMKMSENMEDALPWIEKESSMERMGYLNTLRRVRKFQT